MSAFANKFAVLKELGDVKKTIVISEGGKPKKQKKEQPAAAEATKATTKAVEAKPKEAKKDGKKDAAPQPFKPVNSLAAHKAAIKAQLEAKSKEEAPAAVPATEAPAATEETPATDAPAEGQTEATPAPAPEVKKLTMEEFEKLRQEKRFVAEKKQVRHVDPSQTKGLEEVKPHANDYKIEKKKEAPKPAAKAPAAPAKGKAVKAAPAAPVAAPAKVAPKKDKTEKKSLGDFINEVPAARGGFRGRGGRGGFRGRARGAEESSQPKLEDKAAFPSL